MLHITEKVFFHFLIQISLHFLLTVILNANKDKTANKNIKTANKNVFFSTLGESLKFEIVKYNKINL